MAEIFWEATCSWNMVSIATSIAPTLNMECEDTTCPTRPKYCGQIELQA